MGFGTSSEGMQRRIRYLIIAVIIIFILFASMGSILRFFLNIFEFGELYIKPIYFALTGGLILSFIALFRFDFRNRRSIIWWGIRLVIRLVSQRGNLEAIPPNYLDFKQFKMALPKFLAWQVTKVIIGMLFFMNLLFGMAIIALYGGWSPEIGNLLVLFKLPFIRPPFDMEYARSAIIPLMPILTLVVTPILGAITTRLVLLVGVTQIIRVVTPTVREIGGERPQIGWRIATIEWLIALALFWAMITAFFPSYINYNTKFAIAGLGIIGGIFIFFYYLDGVRGKGLIVLARRRILLRVVSVIIIALIISSAMAVQNSIADAKKIEWLGPFTVQQIGINRHLADLDTIKEIPYNFSINPIPLAQIDSFLTENEEILDKIRLWDWEAALAKIKPEIGLIPYLDFEDSDILRFNHTLYWSASMKPILPDTVLPADRWYAQHLVYTHVPAGFLMLDANEGSIVDTADFFKQRRIYYGEGGLFEDFWAGYPINRQESAEIGGHFYSGKGGLNLPPPLSWIFEFNFLLAFPADTVHVLRYRSVYDRMTMLFPYFQYEWNGKLVDMIPVTDGVNTYYMMPLIVSLDTRHVPWSVNNPYKRLVGYSLIDIYNGTIEIIVLGDDFFSKLFQTAYKDFVKTEVPEGIRNQLRYPQELFEYRVDLYNFYHVTDPATFIVAKEFFEVPEGLDTYYIEAQPPGFEHPEFVGLLSLQLRGAVGRNLAGYMIVTNNYENFGEMIFYEVALDSPIKLIGPTAVLEALERNPEFATLRTLLRNPRVGDNILYRIGNQDVYFIPVYTAGAGGVVAELGTVACVGAAFTGQYFVGLGSDAITSFIAYLEDLAGVEGAPPPEAPTPPPTELTLNQLIAQANVHFEAYQSLWAQGLYEEAGKELEKFIELWQQILERTRE